MASPLEIKRLVETDLVTTFRADMVDSAPPVRVKISMTVEGGREHWRFFIDDPRLPPEQAWEGLPTRARIESEAWWRIARRFGPIRAWVEEPKDGAQPANRFRAVLPDAIPWRERHMVSPVVATLVHLGASDAEAADVLAAEAERLTQGWREALETQPMPMRIVKGG